MVLDRRSGGRLVDAWAGASLVRVGPRGYRDLIMLHGLTEIALLPYDPGSTTDTGVILDDHTRVDCGPDSKGNSPSCISRRRSTGSTAPTAMCAP